MRLLLDSNVLLLLIVGSIRSDRIGGKRLREFDDADFSLVAKLASEASGHVSTPNILTEVSNLLGSGPQQLVEGGVAELAVYVAGLDEIYEPSRRLIALPEFDALGLTDTGIFWLADSNTRVVSVDHHLCGRLIKKGVDVINPRNFRTLGDG